MAHFYFSDDATTAEPGSTLAVTGAEARHAITVGRLKRGERLSIGDGRGTVASGAVSDVAPERFDFLVESVERSEPPHPAVWLAQALAKSDRDELAIQAATELGVDGVIPWAAGRSIVKWEGQKIPKNEQRWQSILREASKQSMRSRIPELRPLATTGALEKLGDDFHVVALDPGGERSLSELHTDGRDILLVVGPEGGIMPTELARLQGAGASVVSLGSRIMRTSTAGPAALAVLNSRLNRW